MRDVNEGFLMLFNAGGLIFVFRFILGFKVKGNLCLLILIDRFIQIIVVLLTKLTFKY